MKDLQTELFIREQVRKILLEKKKKDTGKDPSSGQVYGSIGRGRLPKEIIDIFGGEEGSAIEKKRLASVDPGKLMSNLKLSKQGGETTLERAKSLIAQARKNDVFGQAIGSGEDLQQEDRKGVFFPNVGLPQDRLANLFVYDTIRAAAATELIEMSGHLRVEETEGGVIVYNVRNIEERW